MKFTQFALIFAAMFGCEWTSAADIAVVSTIGVRALLEQVRPDFERSTGHRLNIKYGTAATLKLELDEGESFDVTILPRPMIDDLANHGKVAGTSSVNVAKTGMAVAVKAGTAKPFIGTREAVRTALLAASAIAYTKGGQSGVAAARMFDVLGITGQIKDRIYLDTRPAGGVLAVAEGKAAMGIALLSEIAADPRVDLAGPLPDDLQTYVVFAAGMASGAKDPQGCQAFITFLGAPGVRGKLRGFGMASE